AGSTFKRPEGYFAGKLIQDCGLKGFRVGDAMVSEKHSGFVINVGHATAADVMTLIRHVQQEVDRQFCVRIEPEVRMIGEF
ncbi:MAG: UDP-N-acetylenolpyruvoylglucosamine reductase, partial [Coprococcus sp.]|nr:UDP-N-acetylenolpyruvoylglucosamine reductase [Coprococcus sp.]